ncbi:AAA family ATPase [Variovorax sp. M-6]|uniref:ATP-binding protein n=1 Tax=Variovorax sp. M-6 TaxID=3233041 RepID=UPI003F96901D
MTGQPLLLSFGAFLLDEANARLSNGEFVVPLPPKAFSLLCALAGRPGRLVEKATLLDVVWPRQDVNEAVLKTTVNQLRSALGDDPRQMRFIETVPRRGYRFAEQVTHCRPVEGGAGVGVARGQAFVMPDGRPGRRLIARDTALQQLEASWLRALNGAAQVVMIAGDAGIGKTTLIDHFTSHVGEVLIGRGQCVEQVDAGAPYLPVLEALNVLCHNCIGLPALLRTIAPAWLAQMPWHMASDDRLALQAELAGTGPGRMLRELGELLDCVAQTSPLLLVLEDLQWSDRSTLQLLDYVAGRRSPARQMILVSLRPTRTGGGTHPAADLRTTFRLRGLAKDLALAPFSATEVGDYVAQRFPGVVAPRHLIQTLYAHTDGLPLYVATLLDAADQAAPGRPRGIEAAADGSVLDWLSSQPLRVPESLAHLIERQIESMEPADIALLEAAAVIGVKFWTQPVATMLGRPLQAVRAQVDALTRKGHWLIALTTERLNDDTFDGRSAFRHALYRHAIYDRTGPAVRAHLHRCAAWALEAAARLGLSVGPAELAVHHERSHNLPRAVRYGVDTAQLAITRFAPFEAGCTGAPAT